MFHSVSHGNPLLRGFLIALTNFAISSFYYKYAPTCKSIMSSIEIIA